jgi:hypothetical protein
MKSAARLGSAILSSAISGKAALGAFGDASATSSPEKFAPWQRARAWWKRFRQLSQHRPRRLRLCESLPLGDRRFVAVVEFERSRFLVGGTAASLVLLARLGNAQDPEGGDKNKDAAIALPGDLATEIRERSQL